MIKLIKGDCLEKMKEIDSGSVDMILTDPPYGTMKDFNYAGKSKDNHSWDTTINTQSMFKECDRILRKNGACALFCQDPYTGELMTNAIPNMPFSYRLTWLKDNFANALLVNKAPVNYTEDICLFFKKNPKHDYSRNHPIKPYAKKIRSFFDKNIGNYSRKKLFNDLGNHGCLFFMEPFTNIEFKLCSKNNYEKLISVYGIDKMDGFKDYEYLRKIQDDFQDQNKKDLAEKFPKIFNLPKGQKYKSNVLQYKKDYECLHPTQKPVALLEDLIETYTRPGDTVLDFTMGSGSTAIAALNTGRKFIGIELDDNYFEIAKKRIEDHKNNLTSK